MSNSASTATAASPARRKPRISLAIATALGLGYIPIAPGTFGSLAGVALAFVSQSLSFLLVFPLVQLIPFTTAHEHLLYPCPPSTFCNDSFTISPIYFFIFQAAVFLVVAIIGIWIASRAAAYLRAKDPQIIVVDEVSGQFLALWIGGLGSVYGLTNHYLGHGIFIPVAFPLNWKCLLAGFILFRVFDIWKPFPARQAESLPRGWGIMADDWIAGIYAGLGVLLLRAAGL